MTKRESGWYRVCVSWSENKVLMEWDEHTQRWFSAGYYDGDCFEDGDIQCHDPQMVMTQSGEMVYHNKQVSDGEVSRSLFILEQIGYMDSSDIDGDDVGLRFEVNDYDTGCDISITEECAIAAELIRKLHSVKSSEHDPLCNTKQEG